ncbi:MAG TPA: FAD-dependent oxidoreductase [Acidobacteriaceae bacterium]|nr:FAD-dependent oxidoreductase [Acidobacteriaceae bacterium]
MIPVEADLAIVGSGFAGSLLALIARRIGYSVVLIERGTHPRIVIGESTTPLTNLILEELSDRYDLAEIRAFSKWGSWQRNHPGVACGLKRGFSFFHHSLDHASDGSLADRKSQLLVAASPHDGIADTHWYRADFDHFLVQAAVRAGADYYDRVHLHEFIDQGATALLRGVRFFPEPDRTSEPVAFRARFVIDATGPRGFLHKALQLEELPLPGMPPTQALYTHFSGVGRLEDQLPHCSPRPYPIDDAAVHHIFPGGWIWVLGFNNGITSAGVACTDQTALRLGISHGSGVDERQDLFESAWRNLLDRIPALRNQFAHAEAIRPFTRIGHLNFRSAQISGHNWALLPSAAGFIDPLLSTGFPLTLLGVERLAAMLQDGFNAPDRDRQLADYAVHTDAELLAAGRLIAALYASMDNFPVFVALTMLYFAAVSYAESAHRLGKPELALGFLLHGHPTFAPEARRLLARAGSVRTPEETAQFTEDVRGVLSPINVAGLADPQRRNWYPVDAADLLANAHKLHATREEVADLLDRCGFTASVLPSD